MNQLFARKYRWFVSKVSESKQYVAIALKGQLLSATFKQEDDKRHDDAEGSD